MKSFIRHIISFPYVWLFFIFIFFAAVFAILGYWALAKVVGAIATIIIIAVFLYKPLNVVYGLMGTTGSIQLFFCNFLLISIIFAGIYQLAFFNDAGVSYEVNQPHIDYNLYTQGGNEEKEVVQSDTLIYKKKVDNEWTTEIVVQESKLNYQPIGFIFTWRNTILTALMQEPTDFFLAASTYNESMVDPQLSKEEQIREIQLDKEKAMTFQWILIIQILISWIFFGVFISLLYNKFRYES